MDINDILLSVIEADEKTYKYYAGRTHILCPTTRSTICAAGSKGCEEVALWNVDDTSKGVSMMLRVQWILLVLRAFHTGPCICIIVNTPYRP